MAGFERGDDGRLPASPSGRIPQWVRDEAAGRPVHHESWRTSSPPPGGTAPAPRRRRRRLARLRRWLTAAVVLAAVVAGALLLDRAGLPGSRVAPLAGNAGFPSPGGDAAGEPLGVPLDAPAVGGTHAFVALQPGSGRPVAYDPCRPIRYVVRPDDAPPGTEGLLEEAFSRVSAITGLQFVEEGPTDEQPSSDREPFQPDRYGDRWAPVLVSWQTERDDPELVTAAGRAGSAWVSRPGGPRVYVTGSVTLDAADFAEILGYPGGYDIARAIVLHELGHLVGLGHIDDPSQLMYPETGTALDFASGDLTGLAQLGRGECVPEL
ncbi:matrixin family metalloprotease [Blastococcus sp. SYSU DS0617]